MTDTDTYDEPHVDVAPALDDVIAAFTLALLQAQLPSCTVTWSGDVNAVQATVRVRHPRTGDTRECSYLFGVMQMPAGVGAHEHGNFIAQAVITNLRALLLA